ncbi:hypothetical protein FB451DRAFT_1183315 [Mycena latifolia]|nr:hypothetical protein FB451DRAFT_1183315 [Mycena latifolia]
MASAGEKQRGRKTKLTPEQTKYMEGLYDDFDTKRRRNRLGKFWTDMEKGWFQTWPEEEALGIQLAQPDPDDPDGEPAMSMEDTVRLGVATKKRKEQLHAWFNNRNQKIKKAESGVGKGPVKDISKRSRWLQEVEIYQKCHKAEVNAKVKAELVKLEIIGDNSADTNSSDSSTTNSTTTDSSDSDSNSSSSDSSTSNSSNLRSSGTEAKLGDTSSSAKGVGAGKAGATAGGNSKAGTKSTTRQKQMLDGEDKEEKEAVAKIYHKQGAAVRPQTDALSKGSDEKTPEELQAGPVPKEGGKIQTKAYCSGESSAGLSLTQSIRDWDNLVVAVTGQWLGRCFSREVRKGPALVPKAAANTVPTKVPPTSPALQTKVAKGNGATKKMAPRKKMLNQYCPTPWSLTMGGLITFPPEHDLELLIDPTLLAGGDVQAAAPLAAPPVCPLPRPAYKGAGVGQLEAEMPPILEGLVPTASTTLPEGYPPFIYESATAAPASASMTPASLSMATNSSFGTASGLSSFAHLIRQMNGIQRSTTNMLQSTATTPTRMMSPTTAALPPVSGQTLLRTTPAADSTASPAAPPAVQTPCRATPIPGLTETPPPPPPSSTTGTTPSSASSRTTPSAIQTQPRPLAPSSTAGASPIPLTTGTPPCHHRVLTGDGEGGVAPVVLPPPPSAVLSVDMFPQSRPMSSHPSPRKPQGQAGGEEAGLEAAGTGMGEEAQVEADAREAEAGAKTYDDNGAVIPLALNAPLPHQLSRAENEAITTRVREEWDADHQAKWEQQLCHNPDGLSDPFILKGRPLAPPSLELPAGQKWIRKPAASREMPIPLSARGAKMTKADIIVHGQRCRDPQEAEWRKAFLVVRHLVIVTLPKALYPRCIQFDSVSGIISMTASKGSKNIRCNEWWQVGASWAPKCGRGAKRARGAMRRGRTGPVGAQNNIGVRAVGTAAGRAGAKLMRGAMRRRQKKIEGDGRSKGSSKGSEGSGKLYALPMRQANDNDRIAPPECRCGRYAKTFQCAPLCQGRTHFLAGHGDAHDAAVRRASTLGKM